jgi:hypothetical protein
MKHFASDEKKRQIVTEYIAGGKTLRALEEKHGYDFRVIGSWVTKYKDSAKGVLKKISTDKVVTSKREMSDTEFIASIAKVCQRYGMNADISIKDGKIHEAKIFGNDD